MAQELDRIIQCVYIILGLKKSKSTSSKTEKCKYSDIFIVTYTLIAVNYVYKITNYMYFIFLFHHCLALPVGKW